MKYTKYIYTFFILLSSYTVFGQVYFGIEYQEENHQYAVSLKSDQSVNAPFNTTGTAQITIKLPSSDSFQVSNIVSLLPNVVWNKTIRVNRPTEANDYDYITFGLSSLGTSHIPYEKDSTTYLFTFENIGGACPGIVEIIDNASDVFLYPNSEKLSIKNHISLLATGGNAYAGVYQKEASCKTPIQIPTSTTDLSYLTVEIYPNPATEWLEVSFQQGDELINQIMVYDILGRKVLESDISKEQTKQTLDISRLAKGSYFLRLEGLNHQSKSLPFVKM